MSGVDTFAKEGIETTRKRVDDGLVALGAPMESKLTSSVWPSPLRQRAWSRCAQRRTRSTRSWPSCSKSIGRSAKTQHAACARCALPSRPSAVEKLDLWRA